MWRWDEPIYEEIINEEITDDDMDNFINEEIADDNKDKFNYGLMSDDDILINNMHFKI